VVEIHREKIESDFLGINNETWKAAARDLSASALKLYFYFAANADGFTKALSPAAIENEIGMARSTYHDQFKILVEKGYLVCVGGNRYAFYEKPQKKENTQKEEQPPAVSKRTKTAQADDGFDFESATDAVRGFSKNGQAILEKDIEINNNRDGTDKVLINKRAAGFVPNPTADKKKSSNVFIF
jgi:hypothetical protein